MNRSTPGLPIHHKLPEFTQTHVHQVGDAIQWSHPLSSPSPPAPIPPSIRVFSNESPLHISWPKNWSFSFSISPSSEHPGLISVRMDWLDLLEVQGTLKSLLQHHSSEASILSCSAFFMVQLSYPYMTTGKTIASIEWVTLYNNLILCCPLFLFPSIFHSIRVFSNEWTLWIKWPKYQSFSFSTSPCNEYSGLISFRIDWFGFLVVQGTLKSLLQLHNLKASIIWCSAFFMVQLSHQYMTTGKTIALIIWIFVSKVMSLLFNMLSMFVIVFLSRSKCLLISWLQSLSAVILEPKKLKPVSAYTFSPSICHEVMGPDAMLLDFRMLSFKPAFSLFHPHQGSL